MLEGGGGAGGAEAVMHGRADSPRGGEGDNIRALGDGGLRLLLQ